MGVSQLMNLEFNHTMSTSFNLIGKEIDSRVRYFFFGLCDIWTIAEANVF